MEDVSYRDKCTLEDDEFLHHGLLMLTLLLTSVMTFPLERLP